MQGMVRHLKVQDEGADQDDRQQDSGTDLDGQFDIGQRPPGDASHAPQPAGPAHVNELRIVAVEQAGKHARLAAQDQAVAGKQSVLQIHVEQQALLFAWPQMRQHQELVPVHYLGDGPANELGPGGDCQFGDLAHAIPDAFQADAAERLTGKRGQGEERRGQSRRAQGEDVVKRLAEPVNEVLIEEPHDDADFRVQVLHHEGRRDVDQVVIGHDEDAAALRHAGFLEDFLLPAIALDQPGAAQARIVGGAAGIDDDDRKTCRLQIFQHPPADAAEPTQDDRLLNHDAAGFGLSTE